MTNEVFDKRAFYAKYRERLTQQLEQQGARYWKPKVGTNTIRILPNWMDPSKEFFKEVFIHWNVGENSKKVVCPSTVGRTDCPICLYVEDLYKSGIEEDIKVARGLSRRERFVCNVVDASGKVEGPAIFEMGPQLFKDILYMFTDGDYGDLESLDEGRNIKIERTGTGLTDTKYTAFPAAKVSAIDHKIMNDVYDLDIIYRANTAEEIEKVMLGDAEEMTRVGAKDEEVPVGNAEAEVEVQEEFVETPAKKVVEPVKPSPAPASVETVSTAQTSKGLQLRERIQKLREEKNAGKGR